MHWHWQVEAEPGDPEQNMAVDAALLTDLVEGRTNTPTVRVYTWNQKSISIGRLQNADAVQALYPHLPIVRRPTGGRAVVHGEDLTISAVVLFNHLPLACRSVLDSHECLVDTVKNALEAVGVETCYGGCPIASQKNIVNCFELAASCDLIDGQTGEKLVGSAQRRQGNALLQQMTLSLALIPDHPCFLQHLRAGFDKTFSTD